MVFMEKDNICETCHEDFTDLAGLKTDVGQWCEHHIPAYITENFQPDVCQSVKK